MDREEKRKLLELLAGALSDVETIKCRVLALEFQIKQAIGILQTNKNCWMVEIEEEKKEN